MFSGIPRHPDLVDITADECHALWFAFQAVRQDYILSFATGTERETAERFGLGFRHPGTEEAKSSAKSRPPSRKNSPHPLKGWGALFYPGQRKRLCLINTHVGNSR